MHVRGWEIYGIGSSGISASVTSAASFRTHQREHFVVSTRRTRASAKEPESSVHVSPRFSLWPSVTLLVPLAGLFRLSTRVQDHLRRAGMRRHEDVMKCFVSNEHRRLDGRASKAVPKLYVILGLGNTYHRSSLRRVHNKAGRALLRHARNRARYSFHSDIFSETLVLWKWW